LRSEKRRGITVESGGVKDLWRKVRTSDQKKGWWELNGGRAGAGGELALLDAAVGI